MNSFRSKNRTITSKVFNFPSPHHILCTWMNLRCPFDAGEVWRSDVYCICVLKMVQRNLDFLAWISQPYGLVLRTMFLSSVYNLWGTVIVICFSYILVFNLQVLNQSMLKVIHFLPTYLLSANLFSVIMQ